jgi:hypothetical protein
MARTSSDPNTEIVTFRLPPTLKAAVAEIAAEEAKPVGELLRELIRERIKQKERQEFEAEARRQSLLIAEAAKNPNSDEAQVMRELDANFDEFARELAVQEEAAERRPRKSK